MSLSAFKPVSCGIHPATGANGSPSKPSKVTIMNRQAPPSLQVKEKERPRLQKSLSATSRREMMHLTAASLGLLSLLLPASAEARPRNASMRQKIMEKFEKLREKAGLSKPKDEGQEKKPNDGVESKSKIQDGAKETIMEKFEELREKAGLSKSKDEGQEKKPNDVVESKSKIQDGAETKPKDEKKHANKPEKSTVPSTEGPSVPSLPSIINGSVETTLP